MLLWLRQLFWFNVIKVTECSSDPLRNFSAVYNISKMQYFFFLIIIIFCLTFLILPLVIKSAKWLLLCVSHAAAAWMWFNYSKAQLSKYKSQQLNSYWLPSWRFWWFDSPPTATALIFFFIIILNAFLQQRKPPTEQVNCGWCAIRWIWQS